MSKNWTQQSTVSYWDQYYKKFNISEPSPFALFCLSIFPKNSTLLELGCGNGRDALYFAKNGHRVLACDLSETATQHLQNVKDIHVIHRDFANLGDPLSNEPIDVVYSRFSLHAVDAATASKALEWAKDHLIVGGSLCIEVRSVHDELYGQGEKVDRDAFVTDHYRRFYRQDELEDQLKTLGYHIELSKASRGFAPHLTEDPVIIRIIAKNQ